MCFLLKQGKHTLGYGVTNIFMNHGTICMGKFHKGKIILGQSQNVVCLVINKKQEQSINIKHKRNELCIDFSKKDWWISQTIARA